MAIEKEPDYAVFASQAIEGEAKDFPDLLRGWGITLDETGGMPPMEWFNALQKRTDEWLTYLSQRGIPEWSAKLDYPKDAAVQFSGKFYVAKKDSKNGQPDRSQNDWVPLDVALGVTEKLAKSANLSDLADKSKARDNLGLGDLAVQDSVTAAGIGAADMRNNFAARMGVERVLSGGNPPSSPGVWSVENCTWTPEQGGTLLCTSNRSDLNTGRGDGQFCHYFFLSHSSKLYVATNVNNSGAGWQQLIGQAGGGVEYLDINKGLFIGDGLKVSAGARVDKNISVGEDLWVDRNATIAGTLKVGNTVYQTDGNINGTAWGGYLSNWVNNQVNGRVDWGTFNREVGARATNDYVNGTFVKDIRLGGVESAQVWKAPGYQDQAPHVITGVHNVNSDSFVDIVYRRPVQKNVNNGWYNIGFV